MNRTILFSLRLAGSLAITLALAVPALASDSADLHAYEGFDYPTGQLRDRDGGSGWDGPWRDAHQRVVADESLASSIGDTPATTGGHALTPNGDWPARRRLAEQFATEPGVYWISVLAANTTGEVEETYGRLRLTPAQGQAVGIGKGHNAPNWSVEAGGRTAHSRVPANERPVLLVARLTVSADPESSSIALFVDPDLGQEPLTPDAEVSRVDILPLRDVVLQSGVGERVFAFDEIRLGRSFDAVTPRP
jgi:hypothetical protein